jgi:hypothetical protein
MEKPKADTLKELDLLWNLFNQCRSHFPATSNENVGQQVIPTAPYYVRQGFQVTMCFNSPLVEKDIKNLNRIGHWLNQNFVVRLVALLQSHGVIRYGSNIDTSAPGGAEVKLLRDLRDVFAHTAGGFKRQKKEHRKLLRELTTRFALNASECPDFPLGIGEVLEPLYLGCRAYVNHALTNETGH